MNSSFFYIFCALCLCFSWLKLEAQQKRTHPTVREIEGLKWEKRVVLLYARESGRAKRKAQMGILESDREGLEERDIVVFSITGSAPSLRASYGAVGEFTFVLVGKDGTVKLRDTAEVSRKALYALIDGMPMRRAEMRRQN